MGYVKRLIENDLRHKMSASGAELIKGPKSWGKTETAAQYAKTNDATVFHYNDSYGNEVDAIVQKRNGDYAAFEIKLGVGYIDEAAENLKKFAANIDSGKMESPKSLNIITGTGMSYRRPDGINVISLASLGV